MSENGKALVVAAAEAAQAMSDDQMARLQGLIQGYALACSAAEPNDKSGKEKAK